MDNLKILKTKDNTYWKAQELNYKQKQFQVLSYEEDLVLNTSKLYIVFLGGNLQPNRLM